MTSPFLKKRPQVPLEETWDLTDLFQHFDHWDEGLKALPMPPQIKEHIDSTFRGRLSSSPQILRECLRYRDDINRKLENLSVYAHLREAEDTMNATASQKCGQINHISSMISAEFAFLEPEMLAIPNLNDWSKMDLFIDHQFQIEELLRQKKHVLSEREENMLAQLQVPLNTYENIHSKWSNADLKFPDALDSHGKAHMVSHARYSLNLQSADRTLRKNTFLAYHAEIHKWRHTISETYYGTMAAHSAIARLRNFDSHIEHALFPDNIPLALYDNLIATVRAQLPLLHRSMELRAQALGLKGVAPYDRLIPLFVNEKPLMFTWDEACRMVLAAVQPLGEEYVRIATNGLLHERWADRAENEGKRSGAFSWGTYDSRPYLFQSFTGTLGDVYTLAHELGHSMHSYYSHKNQTYPKASYTIFVAEVASTLNEALLADYVLSHHKGTVLEDMVISENLENFEGTVLRQTLFATFEQHSAYLADQGTQFSPDDMDAYYEQLQEEWYGSNLIKTDFHASEWMRIPHFYSPFYVYKYATSYCVSLALAKTLRENPQQGQEAVFSILKAGGSKPSLEILKRAGIDLLSPVPIKDAFLNYESNLKRATARLLSK